MTRRLPVLFAGLLVLLPAGHAQDRGKDAPFRVAPPTPAAAKDQRSVYTVRGGDPAQLAQVVSRHFKNKVTVSSMSDALVLSGEANDLVEVTKLLQQIDRPARSVEIEVTLVETVAKDDAPIGAAAPTGADVLAKLDDLKKAGATVQRITLTAVEGQSVSVQTGGNKPYASSSPIRGGGQPFGAGGPGGGGPVMQRSVSYHQVGTTVKAVARVEADSAVGVDLSVQDSTIKPPEGPDDAAGAPGFDTASLATQLRVPAGTAVVAQAIMKGTKMSRTVTLVVVTAKVVEAGK